MGREEEARPGSHRALLPLTGDFARGEARVSSASETPLRRPIAYWGEHREQGMGLPQSPGLVASGDEKTLATTVLTSSPQLLFLIVNEVKRQR